MKAAAIIWLAALAAGLFYGFTRLPRDYQYAVGLVLAICAVLFGTSLSVAALVLL